VQECAQSAGERAEFAVQFKSSGEPRDLPTQVQRQVLYITREVLRNVEKHAQASQVEVNLDWGVKDLTVNIHDDGRGFSPEAAEELKGHFGLKMIKEVATEINGTLDLKSEQDKGVQFQLRLPLESKS
jgi:signal transduction histidine kinase